MRAGMPLRMLFEVTALCPRLDGAWSRPLDDWPAQARLPDLGALDAEPVFAQVHVCWSPEGLFVGAAVPKSGPPVSNPRRPESGDSLQVWLNLQAADSWARAAAYCRRFLILPAGGDGPARGPSVVALRIPGLQRPAQAREGELQARCDIAADGYRLIARIGTRALVSAGGWPPAEGVLGFEYTLTDVPLGRQSWACAHGLPGERDPALWGRLRLCEGGGDSGTGSGGAAAPSDRDDRERHDQERHRI